MPARRWSEASSPRPRCLLRSTTAQANELDADELYRRLRSAGQQHGPAFQGIVGLTVSASGVACAAVRLPAARQAGRSTVPRCIRSWSTSRCRPSVRPSVATDLAAADNDEPAVVLPVRLAGMRVHGDVTEGSCAIGSLRATSRPGPLRRPVWCSPLPDGQVLLEIDEIEMAVLQRPRAAESLTSRMFTLRVGAGGSGQAARRRRRASGRRRSRQRRSAAAQLCRPRWLSTPRTATWCRPHDAQQLRNALTRKDISWESVVVLCVPPGPADDALPEAEQLDMAQSRTLLVADIVKTLSQLGARNSPRLWIVTRGAQQVDPGDRVTLAQSGLRGIARVLTFEHPELNTTTVDVDPDGTSPAGCPDRRAAGRCGPRRGRAARADSGM